jgi:hypothetical protein
MQITSSFILKSNPSVKTSKLLMYGFCFVLVCDDRRIKELVMATTRSFAATLSAVAWSFIGLRRKRDFDVDADGALNPGYVIAAGFLGVGIFIGLLMLAVRAALA